ncbi:hypothetical protein [Ochrobactrum sp. MC-1LL]|uniref:hypothetical protein n=1 Tax=Ochrobactrum sp. MC-1LL TaxID=2735351 RepID=UPI00143847E5|nr:hypothetical protein [Ochrobactrum sp. MC-1LL]NKE75364.1 hypothetical protein [Ochrobactrum sp. MC-1LL]NKE77848.1 hypothetical protein [Ochrobactrum sp. MC-1LL]
MVDAPEKIWIEQDECPYFYEESELADVGSPVTEYIRADLCHLPAPAATDTGLKTIGFVPPMFVEGKGADYNDIFRSVSIAENYTDVVTRSQAEELLAAEQEKALFLKTAMEIAQTHCGLKDKTIDSLEAKLAAAEKALEPFVSFFNEAMKGFTEGYAERTPPDKPVLGWNNAYLLMRHFIEARAVLGGKP